jgi:hypothetical protein
LEFHHLVCCDVFDANEASQSLHIPGRHLCIITHVDIHVMQKAQGDSSKNIVFKKNLLNEKRQRENFEGYGKNRKEFLPNFVHPASEFYTT